MRCSSISFAFLSFVTLAACGGPPTAPAVPVTPDVVARARAQWPDATEASLAHGHDTFAARCHKCHELPDVNAQSPKDWPGTLDDMAGRAGLTPGEKTDVLHYLLAAHR
ncbi:MAG TPA: hypothetical protein VHB21_08260 [Minicystis sp.]|nr:hypothetical protein [Minicystis sp.]